MGRSRPPSASTGAVALLLSGICAALAGVAGVCLALSYTLAPAQIYAWIGVVFAAVMLGGVGRPLGPLIAGIVIGVSEAMTMALTAPSWAPLVSFSLLLLLLVARPGRSRACPVLRSIAAILIAGAALATLPLLRLPPFYESFLYLVLHWIDPRDVVEHPVRLFGLFLVRPRRVLRRRRLHDRRARVALRRAVPVDVAGGGVRGSACSGSRSAPSCFASIVCAASCSRSSRWQ